MHHRSSPTLSPLTSPLFTLRLKGTDIDHDVEYPSVADCLRDSPLRQMFDDQIVTDCAIILGDGRRLTSVPFITWARFTAQLDAQARTIETYAERRAEVES